MLLENENLVLQPDDLPTRTTIADLFSDYSGEGLDASEDEVPNWFVSLRGTEGFMSDCSFGLDELFEIGRYRDLRPKSVITSHGRYIQRASGSLSFIPLKGPRQVFYKVQKAYHATLLQVLTSRSFRWMLESDPVVNGVKVGELVNKYQSVYEVSGRGHGDDYGIGKISDDVVFLGARLRSLLYVMGRECLDVEPKYHPILEKSWNKFLIRDVKEYMEVVSLEEVAQSRRALALAS